MKKFMGLFVALAVVVAFSFSLSLGERAGVRGLFNLAHAELGSDTYQRVKAASSPEAARAKTGLQQTRDQTAPQQPASKDKKKKKEKAVEGGKLTIGEDLELTFPEGLKECRVFDSRSLEKAITRAVWKGECEWIILRSGSDWEPGAPMAVQMDKPLVIEDKHPLAFGHPVVITNDTGRAIIFKTPKNGGCAMIINKPDVAIMGFTFDGAVCR